MKDRNTTFTVLSAIAMILVMLGHLDWNVLTFWGLFPYYSYHVLIFVFVSGYFYKPENENNILKYIVHKAKTLMLPYFVWNLIYGLVACMLHSAGIQIGEGLSVYNLLVAPFAGGHQFMYNATAWFVPALFLLEICNVIARRILSFVKIRNEWIIMAGYLAVGVFAVFMAIRGSVYDYYKIPGRLMVMAPALQLGRIYRDKLEKIDRLPAFIYIPVLFAVNLLLVKTQGGLNYSVVWVTGFANGPVIPFVTAVTGIALWLRIAKLIAELLDGKFEGRAITKAIKFFGSNTYSVMMHQLIAFMGIKSIFAVLANAGVCADFDKVQFATDVYYTYVPSGLEIFKLVYMITGIIISLLIGAGSSWIAGKISAMIKKERNKCQN